MKFASFTSVAAIVAATVFNHANAEPGMDHEAILATINSMTTSFANGKIDGVMQTYEPGAVVVAEPGRPVSGEAELRRMFADFIASGVNFTYGAHDVVVAGDTGLHLMSWTAPGPDGPMTALLVAVLKRQRDGAWKMIIDHPFGDSVMHDTR